MALDQTVLLTHHVLDCKEYERFTMICLSISASQNLKIQPIFYLVSIKFN